MTDIIDTTAAQRYRNPLGYTDGASRTDPDPFAMKYRGRYYCYSTDEAGVGVSVSDDLVTWESHGFAIRHPEHQNFWAPCVVHHNGTFYMYVSTAPAGSTDPHDERLRLAVAENPLGPFRFVKTFFDEFSIDADVVRDRDGRWYLFYSVNDLAGWGHGNPGTAIVVDELVAFDRVAGRPQPVVVPALREEIYEQNRYGDGRDWFTVEGATYFTHADEAFITYSGNAYVREDYFIGYSRASLTGGIRELAWQKYPGDDRYAPLVRRSTEVEGTGHNSVITGPDLVERWLLYHGRDADDVLDPDREQRTKRIDRLWIDGSRLSTDAPTTGGAAPTTPHLRDQFAGTGLAPHWDVQSGVFELVEREAIADGHDLTLVFTRERFEYYRAEVDVAAHAGDGDDLFGVVVCGYGREDFIEVVLSSASRRVRAVWVRGGERSVLAEAALTDEDLTAFHCLRIDRRFERVVVDLDGVRMLVFSVPDSPATFGLVSHGTRARFSGFALTRHCSVYGRDLDQIRHLFAASGHIEADADGVTAGPDEVLQLESTDMLRGAIAAHLRSQTARAIAAGAPLACGLNAEPQKECLCTVTVRCGQRKRDSGRRGASRVESHVRGLR